MSIDCDADPAGPAFIVAEDTPEHDRAVEALHERVFGPGRHARAAARLREGNRLHRGCSRLAFKALDGLLLATARLWPLALAGEAADPCHRPALLGPVAVLPEIRGAGVGLKLCDLVIEAGFANGFTAIVLVGDLSYFSRLGFEVADRRLVPLAPVVPGRLLVRCADGDAPVLRGRLSVPRATRPASSEQEPERRRGFPA